MQKCQKSKQLKMWRKFQAMWIMSTIVIGVQNRKTDIIEIVENVKNV